MSSQIPPDPITNNYNPSAWAIPELTEEEIIALDKAYIKFPIAQNQPITFPSQITIPTPASNSNTNIATTTAWVRSFWTSVLAATNTWTGTQSFTNNMIVPTELTTSNTTVAASTAWVRNFFTYILTEPWSWSGIQSFTGGITANIINPVTAGGTLTIGNNVSGDVFIAAQVGRTGILHLGDGNNSSGAIHIGNGANATNNVNLLNGAGSTGVLNLGSATSTTRVNTPLTPNYTYPVTSGKIGYINSVSVASLAVTPGTAQNLTQLTSLPAGVWFLQFDTYLTVGMVNGSFITLGINTSSATLTGARAQNTIYVNGTTPAPTNSISMTVSISAATTYYAIGLSNIAGTYNWTNIVFSATRIA